MSEENTEQHNEEAPAVEDAVQTTHPLHQEVHHMVGWFVLAVAAVLVFVLVYFYVMRDTPTRDVPAPVVRDATAVQKPWVYTDDELDAIMRPQAPAPRKGVYFHEELEDIMGGKEGTPVSRPSRVYTQNELEAIMR